MISIKRALMDDRALRATIGLSASEFNLNRSNACRNVQKLTPILEKVLGKKMALPNMEINSLEELFEIFPGAKDIFIDGTERPIQRPKDEEKQKESYSGKKKVKSTIMVCSKAYFRQRYSQKT
jgi:hypothetical protein